MKNRYKSNSIITLALILICASIFVPILSTFAWFTSGEGKSIVLVAHIADINLNLYQVSSSGEETHIESDTPTYIDLSNGGENLEILPDEEYALHLILKNEDVGTSSVNVRFKIELYSSSAQGDVLLNTEIIGYTTPTASTSGFTYSDTDGYYFYSTSSGDDAVLNSGAVVNIITGFVIPYSSFIDESGEPLFNGNNLKIVVNIETY